MLCTDLKTGAALVLHTEIIHATKPTGTRDGGGTISAPLAIPLAALAPASADFDGACATSDDFMGKFVRMSG